MSISSKISPDATIRPMKIIGIDPGYDKLGVAVLEKLSGKEVLLFSDCVKTSAKDEYADRLLQIGEELEKILKKWKPEVLAIEKLFFTSNQKTAIGVAGVRGLVIYLAKKHGLSVFEFTPLEIKTCVTGYGKSSKEQVISMVNKLIKINKTIKEDDEYDAIATGLTGLARNIHRQGL